MHNGKRITNTQLEYYLNRGMSIDDAKNALKLRQTTCSLSSFKRRYGEELGLLKYSERNAKWLYTLEQKSDEEKLKIKEGRLKGLLSAASSAISKEETFILDLLEQTYNITIDRQYKLYYKNNIYSFDR